MIVLAIIATICALVWSFLVIVANSMRPVNRPVDGRLSLIVVWSIAAVMWLAWWFS